MVFVIMYLLVHREVYDTQQMYTPHPLDRNALGDSKTNPTSASGTRVAGPALYPTANNHAPSSMAVVY